MIIGTAGHIDHGKTTLVRALTGVDTDRLPEEKARGISIELGYAYMTTASGQRLGFVDVPGHERLVHTMVAGATGIDYALLLVAADDGVMPQTREHFAVLNLLGLTRGAVVITKIDRVESTRIAAIQDDVQHLVAGSPFAQAPVLSVAAPAGIGIPELLATLEGAATTASHQAASGAFRLAIDRVFTRDGWGTVVAGCVHAGSVAIGDPVLLVPGGKLTRIRSIHVNGMPAERATPGARAALGLAGVDKDAVHRGMWATDPGIGSTTQRFDAHITCWQGESKALRSGQPIHVHVGAMSTTGTLAILDTEALAAGASGYVQVVCAREMGLWWGDRIVLRDASAQRTLAGGTVIDVAAPSRYRRSAERLAILAAMAVDDHSARLLAVLGQTPDGVNLARWQSSTGALALDVPPTAVTAADWLWDQRFATAASIDVVAALARYHVDHPDELGPDLGRLRRWVRPRLPMPLWHALIAEGQTRQAWTVAGACVHLPEHAARLSAVETRIAEKVAPLLLDTQNEGLWARDLAKVIGESEPLVRVTLSRLARQGRLHQIVRDLYYSSHELGRLAALVKQVAAADGGSVNAARFRDATGLGRKRAIQILEYFDRVGLLWRVGDLHKLRSDCLMFEASTAKEGESA
jgi:selenocysteine-specific elongation factor